MMTVYLIEHDNYTPDGLVSTTSRTSCSVQLTPPRGNSGSHPVITEGWLGTTNDQCATACGAFDLDDEEDREKLAEALTARNVTTTVDEIAAWAENADDDYLDLDLDELVRESESCTYRMDSENDWFPKPKQGWSVLDAYCDGKYGSESFEFRLEDEEIGDRLTAADLCYDRVYEHERDSTGASTMIVYLVHTDDYERAQAALEAKPANDDEDEDEDED